LSTTTKHIEDPKGCESCYKWFANNDPKGVQLFGKTGWVDWDMDSVSVASTMSQSQNDNDQEEFRKWKAERAGTKVRNDFKKKLAEVEIPDVDQDPIDPIVIDEYVVDMEFEEMVASLTKERATIESYWHANGCFG
jgi:hypothetical protein